MRTPVHMTQFGQRANIKVGQKLDKTAAETFEMMQKIYGEYVLSHSFVVTWHRISCKEETVWKMMCVLVGHKQFEMNARSKKLQRWCVLTAPNR